MVKSAHPRPAPLGLLCPVDLYRLNQVLSYPVHAEGTPQTLRQATGLSSPRTSPGGKAAPHILQTQAPPPAGGATCGLRGSGSAWRAEGGGG